MEKFFKNVKISGLSVVVPRKEINIYDEAQYYDNSIKKIDRLRKMVGFYKRRVADRETTASDLAINAVNNLLLETNICTKEIDALINVVQEPDYKNPATAYFIHNKLGLPNNCIATDINQGCAGWVFGLFMASQMIESGSAQKVLLLNADTPSINKKIEDRNLAPIFGDAGVATLIEYSEQDIHSYFNIETRSEGFEAIIPPLSGERFRINYSDDKDIELINKIRNNKITTAAGNEVTLFDAYMDGMAVFDFTMSVVPENIKQLLKYANLTPDDIPALCLHQANKQIVQTVGNAAGFNEEKTPYCAFENYGNNTMCSIPTTISMLDKETNKRNLCCSGFGNGLVCASCIINLENTYIGPIRDFQKPEYIKTKEEYIEYWTKKIKGENNE